MHKRLVDEILMLDNARGEHSIVELASAIGVSGKTIRADLKDINAFLKKKGLEPLELRNGILEVPCRLNAAIRKICNLTFQEYFLSREERLVGESLFLIFSGNRTTMQEMADFLSISRSTVLLDMNGLKDYLAQYRLRLVGYSSQGSELTGEEIDVRRLFAGIFGKWPLLVKIFCRTLIVWTEEKQAGLPEICRGKEVGKSSPISGGWHTNRTHH